ncbi:hypothetical protein CLU96_0598 [Chryseobacterium sp. 52]|uniref:hypothetical protein n=1 Tax=Chryseobacterium sp. 52 TaxID=2035213 RepID=UPI000C1A31B1|nr:hypothetical protein [Chryseobacterium sp. 52]PIF43686.1 hypothetical protein CLU96_0598 [Chryseobacterium sp. 52]
MSNVKIYKNGKLKLDSGTYWDYEEFKKLHGYYSIIDLLMKLLEDKIDLSQKIMQQHNFILSKEEKDIIAKKMEEYIEKDIHDFKEAEDLEDYINIYYKNKLYKMPFKRSELSLERKLLKAMSLYDKFNDPNNSNIIEIKFN